MANITWLAFKQLYLDAYRRDQLVDLIFQQACDIFGSRQALLRLGHLHEAGNFLVLNLACPQFSPFSLSLFVHKFDQSLTYVNLYHPVANLVWRLPDLHLSS